MQQPYIFERIMSWNSNSQISRRPWITLASNQESFVFILIQQMKHMPTMKETFVKYKKNSSRTKIISAVWTNYQLIMTQGAGLGTNVLTNWIQLYSQILISLSMGLRVWQLVFLSGENHQHNNLVTELIKKKNNFTVLTVSMWCQRLGMINSWESTTILKIITSTT